MLIIELPGALNKFVLSVPLQLKKVADQISSTFYPYVKTISCKTNHENTIFIELNSGCVFVCVTNERSINIPFSNEYDAYKKVVTIIRDHIKIKDGFCMLHGSAIIINGQAVLFLSETFGGKSSLSVFFDMQENVTCLTDDLIIIEISTLKVYPVSKTINLRNTALTLFDNKLLSELTYNELITRYEYPLSEERFATYNAIKKIFIIHRGYDTVEIKENENKFKSIIDNMYLPYSVKNNVMASIKLYKQVLLYDLYYNNLEECYTVISTWLKNN